MPVSLSATALLDLAGLALAVSIIANFTKRFVQLAVARFSPDTQAALVRGYIYLLSFAVVVFALARTGHWNNGAALADAIGPAFSVFLAAVATYHVLSLDTSSTDPVPIPPGHALALIPLESPAAPPDVSPADPPAS
jgi:protein-S-isoprenylcysteine O-methyltransferase Ste14